MLFQAAGGGVDKVSCSTRAIDTPMLNPIDMPSRTYFTHVLYFYVKQLEDRGSSPLGSLLNTASDYIGLLNEEPKYPAISILSESLRLRLEGSERETVYTFLDNCISRFAKAPVRYYDAMDDLRSCIPSLNVERRHGGFSPLLMTAVEQLPYLSNTDHRKRVASVIQWLVRWVKLSLENGGDKDLLETASNRIRDFCVKVESANESGLEVIWNEANEFPIDPLCMHSKSPGRSQENIAEAELMSIGATTSSDSIQRGEVKAALLCEMAAPPMDRSNVGLVQWRNKPFPEFIEDNSLDTLVHCLCSGHEEVRKQALISLRHVLALVQVSFLAGSINCIYILREHRNPTIDTNTSAPLPWAS